MRKYKYVGRDGYFSIDLIAYGIMDKNKLLMKGDIIEVPEDNVRINESMKVTGHFKEIKNKDNKVTKKDKEKK